MDYYLKANTEAELWNVLEQVGAAEKYDVKNEQGEVIESKYRPTVNYSIDVIGTIYKPTGNVIQTELGTIVDELEALEGFHMNVRGPSDLSDKVEYIPYQPTAEEEANPEFVLPNPTEKITSSPLKDFLVFPKQPSRVWA